MTRPLRMLPSRTLFILTGRAGPLLSLTAPGLTCYKNRPHKFSTPPRRLNPPHQRRLSPPALRTADHRGDFDADEFAQSAFALRKQGGRLTSKILTRFGRPAPGITPSICYYSRNSNTRAPSLGVLTHDPDSPVPALR